MQVGIPNSTNLDIPSGMEDRLQDSNKSVRANYASDASEKLRQAIVAGKLRPNQRVVESDLAKQFGMSRTPIREALKKLEMQGYLSRLNNGGLVITDHSPDLIREIYEIRDAIETSAIRLACQRATEEQLDKAAEYHAQSLPVIRNHDVNQFIELNSAFHNELLSACGNGRLWSLIQVFRDQFFDRRLVRTFNTGDWTIMAKHHQRLLDAVRERNPRLAEKAVHEHVHIAMRIALERL